MAPYLRPAKVEYLRGPFSRTWRLIASLIFLLATLSVAQESPDRRPELVAQTGHTQAVKAVTLTPDGRWLASGSEDGSVKLWEVATGHLLCTLPGGAVVFSPDGSSLAIRSGETIKLWGVNTCRELRTLEARRAVDVGTVGAFSPDGRWLVSWGRRSRGLVLWDVATGKPRIMSGSERVRNMAVAFSPDSRWLASGISDGTVKLWDVNTARELRTLGTESDVEPSVTVAFSPDGRWLASGSFLSVRVWHVGTGRELRNWKSKTSWPVSAQAVAFSADGCWLAGSLDNSVKFWDVATGRELRSLPGDSMAFSADAGWLPPATLM